MKLCILGGGASGLAAATAAKIQDPGVEVTVLEGGERIGRKLLSTGNGRCNLAPASGENLADNYSRTAFCEEVFSRAPYARVLDFLREIGVEPAVEGEGLYPYSFHAASVLDAFRMRLKNAGVRTLCGYDAARVLPRKPGFSVRCANGEELFCDRLIAACGGCAQSEFNGYRLMEELGHTVTPLVPALAPLRCAGGFLKGLSGIRVRAEIALLEDGGEIASENGEILFRDYGLSGIPVFQLSHALAKRLSEGSRAKYALRLNLFPDVDLRGILERRRDTYPELSASELFTGILHRRVAENLLEGISGPISRAPLDRVERSAKKLILEEVTPLAFSRAQVTAGGVAAEEVNPSTLESRLVPGLYLAGELLEPAGRCGGYNLLWAWATGCLAGSAACD